MLRKQKKQKKNKSSKVNKNNSNDEEESEPIPLRDVKGSGKRIEQKTTEEEIMRKTRDHYNKFINKIGSVTYSSMRCEVVELRNSIYDYFNIRPATDNIFAPFYRLDSFKLQRIKECINDLTDIAKEALSGVSKTQKSNKDYFDELMEKFSPQVVLNHIGFTKCEFPDNMDKSIEHLDYWMRCGDNPNTSELMDVYGIFMLHIDGNDINGALEKEIKFLQKNIKTLTSLESPLKNLKSIFEQFKNKYKAELNDELNRAEGDQKKELQNYLLKVNATGIENIGKLIKFYYKCTLSDISNYRKLAEYTRTEIPRVYIRSQIKLALDDDPNLDKIPEFHLLKQQYFDKEE